MRPETQELLRQAERDAQKLAGWLRLGVGAALLLVALMSQAEALRFELWPLAAVVGYFVIGVVSLAVASSRWFSTAWAPVFVVIDVLWYYSTLIVELLAFQRPPNEFVTMPVFGVLFVLIALAGMRYTPWALLAGLATFAVLDTTFFYVVSAGFWPGVPGSDDDLFGFGVNVFRIATVAGTGLVIGLTSLRARRTLIRALETRAERDAIRTLFGRYVPQRVAAEMVAQNGVLPPRNAEATILIADIEGFTHHAEDREPEALVTMMNAFFRRTEAVIRTHDGVVAHFQGDGILATFNIPLPREDHADRALSAAVALADLTARESFAGERLPVRVGVATGTVTAGVVGGSDRLAYTVYGDVVNVAARLQDANKRLGTRVLAAGPTVAALRRSARLTPLGPQSLPGRTTPLDVFTPTLPPPAAATATLLPGPGAAGREA